MKNMIITALLALTTIAAQAQDAAPVVAQQQPAPAVTTAPAPAPAVAPAQEQINLDLLKGNTLTQDSVSTRPDGFTKIQKVVGDDAKIKCNNNGCELYVYDCTGREFRVTVGAGRGQAINNGFTSGSGVVINNNDSTSNGDYYGISFTYVNSAFKHTIRIPESMYTLINTYLEYMKTKEYVEATMKQRPETVSKDLELVLSLAATLRGAQCTNGYNNYLK